MQIRKDSISKSRLVKVKAGDKFTIGIDEGGSLYGCGSL